MSRSILTLALALSLAVPAAFAQSSGNGAQKMAALQAEVAQGKQAYISRQLAMDPAEQAAFWPVYDKVQEDLADLAERRRANAAAVTAGLRTELDEDDAEELADEAVAIEVDQAKLMERTYRTLSRVVAPRKALAYVQAESRLATLQRYEIAGSQLP
ncbi:hypothetical protein [Arenimonas metalli]|uniref:Uncharacterized protein n=1 Tax=Arenimonas metalli CF5-1 TaxID=1384056 RepID=A0A091AQ84_9GAMM|nr:hypothetical protein [Arenimonas metalli]KFN41511.1 hypothetical protein N787_06015 [Arenimonas metalli CF5-1]